MIQREIRWNCGSHRPTKLRHGSNLVAVANVRRRHRLASLDVGERRRVGLLPLGRCIPGGLDLGGPRPTQRQPEGVATGVPAAAEADFLAERQLAMGQDERDTALDGRKFEADLGVGGVLAPGVGQPAGRIPAVTTPRAGGAPGLRDRRR